MPDIHKFDSLAEAFMKASGFYQGGHQGTLGEKVMQGMNDSEKEEYSWELPRRDIHWAEFFSKVAVREGYLDDAAALVPTGLTNSNTVSDLARAGSPQFALVVSAALQKKAL